MIRLSNVTIKFGEFTAIHINELHVPKKCIFGFLGKNGAGKTTTIKTIIGMLQATTGDISVGDYNMKSNFFDVKKIIGYVADKPNVYEYLTGVEFVRFMANLYGIKDSSELEDEIQSWLKRLDLQNKANELISGYSHGTKQKIALIGALIHKPQLLILDEPTVGLDPQSTKELKEIIIEFRNNGGTVFLSTHILEIAEQICDEYAIIDKGNILATFTQEKLKTDFDNKSLEDIFLMITEKGVCYGY